MNDLIKVEGVDACFCDIIFIRKIYINNVQRTVFPRQLYYLLKDVRRDYKYKSHEYIARRKRFVKEISLLIMNIGNLYNCVDEVYGLVRGVNYVTLPKDFITDFDNMIDGLSVNNKTIHLLPSQFIIEEKYYPSIALKGVDDIYFNIIKVRPQAISYLKQELDIKKLKWVKKLINVFELMNKYKDDNIEFDKFIDGWAKKLLLEVK